MIINRSIDIEDEIRQILTGKGITAYCRPLPDGFSMPSILATATGGTQEETWSVGGKIDTFSIVLDSRAESDADAFEYLRTALAVLKAEVSKQTTKIGNVSVNSMYSWGVDPVRPDISMCSASIRCTAHLETATIYDSI